MITVKPQTGKTSTGEQVTTSQLAVYADKTFLGVINKDGVLLLHKHFANPTDLAILRIEVGKASPIEITDAKQLPPPPKRSRETALLYESN